MQKTRQLGHRANRNVPYPQPRQSAVTHSLVNQPMTEF